MPKTIFNNGTISVQLDASDPQDAAQITINNHHGKAIAGMLPPDLVQLVTALNTKFNLGLLP
jgi:hypothetical protein